MQVDTSSGTTVVLLREEDEPRRVLAIFVGPAEAASIAIAVSDEPPERPSTHDLVMSVTDQLGVSLDAVAVTAIRDDTFVAELTFTGPAGEFRLDSRPSDAIALALRADAPVYVTESVLEEAGALFEEPDDEAIDREVAEFRAQLDELDPTDFLPGDLEP
jgi:bifunctional DNase/RNase